MDFFSIDAKLSPVKAVKSVNSGCQQNPAIRVRIQVAAADVYVVLVATESCSCNFGIMAVTANGTYVSAESKHL